MNKCTLKDHDTKKTRFLKKGYNKPISSLRLKLEVYKMKEKT